MTAARNTWLASFFNLASIASTVCVEVHTTLALVKTHVEFQSEAFPPYESEAVEVNPGRFGKRVAEFFASELAQEGFRPGAIFAEDWGWVVPIDNEEFPLWVGCGNYEEYPNGFLCFIEPHKPVIRKLFKKIDTTARVAALQQALHRLLSSRADVSGIKWWSHEEFNDPKSR